MIYIYNYIANSTNIKVCTIATYVASYEVEKRKEGYLPTHVCINFNFHSNDMQYRVH